MFFNKNKIILYMFYIFLPLISEFNFSLSTGNYIIFIQFLIMLYIIYNIKASEIIELKGKNIYLTYLLLVALLSTIDSDLRVVSFKRFLLVGGNLFVTNILIHKVIKTREDLLLFVNYLSIVFISIGIVSTLYQILITNFGHYIIVDNNIVAQSFSIFKLNFIQIINGRRPSSFFKNPNTYALFLLISQIFLIWNIVKKNINYKLGIVFFIVQFYGLVSTKSRSAMLSLFVYLLISMFMYQFDIVIKMNKKLQSFVMVIAFLIIMVMLRKIIVLRPGSSGRLNYWMKGISSIYRKPLLGIGFGVSSEIILPNFGMSLHNSFIKIASEIGLFGFLLFIYFIYDALIVNFKHWLKYKSYENIFFIATIISLSTHEMFEGLLLSFNFLNNLFFILILISLCYEVTYEETIDHY